MKNLICVSAPSGSGKTTLCKAIRKLRPDLVWSVSCTTRSPRNFEIDGKDYYFKSKEDVFSAILEDGWIKIWESIEPVFGGTDSPRKTFVNLLIKIAEYAKNRPGLFEFLFNAPKAVKLEEQPWKEYQHRLYGVIQGLLEDGIKAGEFPEINPKLLFKALGGLFMGLVFMGNKNEPVTESDVEKLLNKLITDPKNND
mgnify:CR=1 FL=1